LRFCRANFPPLVVFVRKQTNLRPDLADFSIDGLVQGEDSTVTGEGWRRVAAGLTARGGRQTGGRQPLLAPSSSPSYIDAVLGCSCQLMIGPPLLPFLPPGTGG
jgi:hypothetical protein